LSTGTAAHSEEIAFRRDDDGLTADNRLCGYRNCGEEAERKTEEDGEESE
jgi:hypothetical protein